ncbi:Histidine methyltransferase 1 [Quillaja saponaria]|uniref:Histidine methyltransferase 1 n=1 Tax=Quillaja saponaria TaxID=32244 RepID=A0AAD7KX59_QUISA|nr:Histidine methyltransferase 1 [Quillaja saponaria]
MRTPSLLAQCLPGLVPHDRGSHSITFISETDVHVPSPAVEIIPSKVVNPYKYIVENLDLLGQNVLKGRVSVADVIGLNGSEMIPAKKPDGYMKSWDSSIDLVSVLKHEIRDGQMSFRGKTVLELSCNYGVPGIFACLKGASTVHFQDLNAETIRCTTIPNVLANLEQARDRQSRQPEIPLTPSRQSTVAPSVHFYAGNWEELPAVLSVVKNDGFEVTNWNEPELLRGGFHGWM